MAACLLFAGLSTPAVLGVIARADEAEAGISFGDDAQPVKRVDWDLKEPVPTSDGRPATLERASELSCARCHARITAEWASSTHATAWVSEPYQEQIGDMKRPESCHGCHAPLPLFAAEKNGALPQKPAARDIRPVASSNESERDRDAHFGVSCASCHEGKDGAMLGPFVVSTPAHTSTQDPRFTDESPDDVCIACHATTVGPVLGIAKDFVDTDQASKGKSCVGCHLQRVTRPIAAEAGKPAYEARPGRSHALQTPRDATFLRRAFRFTARVEGSETVVAVHNECGHRVPGLIGRTIRLEFAPVDAAAGTSPGRLEIDRKTPLATDGLLEVRLAGSAKRVRVTGVHDAPGFDEPASFLDVTVDVAP